MKCIENNKNLCFDFHVVSLSLEGRSQRADGRLIGSAKMQARFPVLPGQLDTEKTAWYNKCAGVQAHFA
jgi:hypothetical protein